MELVRNDQPLVPITIDEAVHSINQLILDVVKKNRTMVDYYIYPKETPSEIEAYKPRLEILYMRVENLARLDLPKLTLLADHAAALISAFLLPIIDQLINAITAIQDIFINHYDRELERRRPYGAAYDALVYREKQLKNFQQQEMMDSHRRLPETLISTPHGNDRTMFCRYAVAFTNGRDQGKLTQVLSDDLTSEEKDRLRTSGGAFLWWDCPGCAFRVKYHIVSSVNSGILSTDDVRTHASAPEIEYRPSWLVKCHLYQAQGKERRGSNSIDNREISPTGKRRLSTTTDVRRGSIARRQSEIKSPRSSGTLFWFGAPKRSNSDLITDRVSSTRSKEQTAKYGCPFCFVTDKAHGHMDYRSGRELSEHVASRHGFKRPPGGLMLEKYMVGLNGKCAEHVRRWDLNICRHYDLL